MLSVPSLLRLEEHKALSAVTLSGRVLDLGGDKNSEYLRFFRGAFETITVNFSENARPDIVHDLEKPLPIPDLSCDHVVLFNVLEHIFEYRALLHEAARVLRPGGSVIVVVPFLFPVHPSPEDYRRFSGSALRKELELLGLHSVSVRVLGGGVFMARYLLLDRLLPRPLRFLNFYTCRYLVYGLDALMLGLSSTFRKSYDPKTYALGFCAVAKK